MEKYLGAIKLVMHRIQIRIISDHSKSYQVFDLILSGRNLCPESNPFAYDFGRKCCNSPIANDAFTGLPATQSRMLSPNDPSDPNDFCLGASVSCPGHG